MTNILYWLVYHLDLGPLGPKILDLAVRNWLKRAKERGPAPMVRRRVFGLLPIPHLEPNLRADQRI